MAPISVQLYTLRDEAAKDFFGVLKTVADIGYTGVEFAGLHGKSPAEVRKVIDDLGIKASSSHTAFPSPENINELIETEQALGSSYLITGFGPDRFTTLDDVKRTAHEFQTAAELVNVHGLSFGMHNHWWEFNDIAGQTGYDHVLEDAPNIFSELDVYWAAYGGKDPAEVVAKHKGRIPFLHIKDGDLAINGPMKAVGTGKLDFPSIVSAADPLSLKWLVVELDACATDMTEAVRASYQYLVSNGLASGRK